MKFLATLFSLFMYTLTFAQGQLNGHVIDEQTKEGIEYVTITIKNEETPSRVLGAKTDSTGQFKITAIPFGHYKVIISSIGYENYSPKPVHITNANAKQNIEVIKLVPNSKQLSTVVIRDEKLNIDIQPDKKVFNVAQNISSQGGTLADVLRNVPGVSVDGGNEISLRGKNNVTLLVDGKQNAQFADVATALASIPADNIESIEVITNPSAKYDAQGMGGIINVVMKQTNKKKGLSGSANFGAQYNYKLNAGTSINYRPSDKVAYFLNLNGGYGNNSELNTYNRSSYITNDTYFSTSTKYRKPGRLNGSAGLEYNLNKANKLTWTNSFFRGRFKGDDVTDILVTAANNIQKERWFRENIYTAWPSSNTTDLKWDHSFSKPKQKLSASVNLSNRNYIRESDYETHIYDEEDILINSFTQRNPINGGNVNGAFQIDYEHPLGEESKLEIGERSYMIHFKSKNKPTIQYFDEAEQEETLLKNNFNYIQQIHGVYSTFSTKYQDFAFQFGLRGEYFKYDGTAVQLNSNFKSDFLSFFPSAFISKKIDEKSDINFNYSRRVNRPSFFDLLPFIRINSPLDTSIGNPNVRSEFINAFELSYNTTYLKNSTFLISGYYQYTTDIIQKFRRFNPDGSTFSQTLNLASGTTFGIEVTNQWQVRKGWDITLNANGFRNIINGSNTDSAQNYNGYGGLVKLVNNTRLGQDWSFQISGNYFAPKVIVQGTRKGFGFMDVALKKALWDNQLTISLLASDIFNSDKNTTVYDLFPDQYQSTYNKEQTRFVGINVQYNFPKSGTIKSMKGKKGKTDAKSRDENLKDGGGGDGF